MAIIPRSQILVAIVLLVNAILLLVYVGRYRPVQPEMESLAQFPLETGQPTWVPAVLLNYFGLTIKDSKFYQLKAVSDSGKTKAIQVRYRKSGEVDMFLLELLPNSSAGYFCFTSTHGRLTQAAYFDDGPEAVSDAQERFQNELGFWKHWHSEKLKQL